MINGVKVKMLVDIGVIVIMLLLVLMKVVGEYCEVQVQEFGMKVFIVDGEELVLEGKVNVEVEIGNYFVKMLVLVVDFQVEGILGLDMIKCFDMIIDMKYGVLLFQDEWILVFYEGKFGCFRVVVKEMVSIFF